MRSDSLVKHMLIAFGIAVVFYAAGFGWMQHHRAFRGPWVVTFHADAKGVPSVDISETNLSLTQHIVFPTHTVTNLNLNESVDFTEAVSNLPFGKMLFQDPTFLPGNVTMRLFDHDVELLPRMLMIDRKEIAWRSQPTIELR